MSAGIVAVEDLRTRLEQVAHLIPGRDGPTEGIEVSLVLATELEAVLRAVDAGLVVVPAAVPSSAAVAEAPLAQGRTGEPIPALSGDQRRLLELLAGGSTVAEAAAEVGCSDRQARRLLRRVWDELGVRNRVEGMVRLAHLGLLRPVVGDDGCGDPHSPPRRLPSSGHIHDQRIQGGGPLPSDDAGEPGSEARFSRRAHDWPPCPEEPVEPYGDVPHNRYPILSRSVTVAPP